MQIDKFIDPTFTTSIVFYVTWITIHHISSHLYAHFCVGNDLYSFLLSPFVVVTPFSVIFLILAWVSPLVAFYRNVVLVIF